jgi:hypothetical protein
MIMKAVTLLGVCLCLSCAPPAIGGQGKEAKKPMTESTSDSNQALTSHIEGIPGIDLNNLGRYKDSIQVTGSKVQFELYFEGALCREIRYILEQHADSLLITQVVDACVRTMTAYGVRGTISGLASGKYQLIVTRGIPYILTKKAILVP